MTKATVQSAADVEALFNEEPVQDTATGDISRPTNVNLAALTEPFDESLVRQVPTGNGTSASYVPWVYYADALDEAFGVGRWSTVIADKGFITVGDSVVTVKETKEGGIETVTESRPPSFYVSLRITGTAPENGLGYATHENIGEGKTFESAYATAFKRTLAMFGKGREFYRKEGAAEAKGGFQRSSGGAERPAFTGQIKDPDAAVSPAQLGLIRRMEAADIAQQLFGKAIEALSKQEASDVITEAKNQGR